MASEDSYVLNTVFLEHYNFSIDRLLNNPLNYQTRYCFNKNESVFKFFSTQFTLQIKGDRKFVEPGVNVSSLSQMIENYRDVLYCRRLFEDKSIMKLYCAHMLNHILRCHSLIDKNNAKASKSTVPDDALRDQGFHHARVLVLLPTRDFAKQVVDTILGLMPKDAVVSKRKRFEEEFGIQSEGSVHKKLSKPDDFNKTFANNTNDHFRIGIKISRKSVKLYSAFANSDIIIASPLGLKSIIDDNEEDKELDIQNITASIDMVIIDRADFLLLQNWRNVQLVLAQLNERPTISNFPNPTRIRFAHLAGLGKLYRQSLVFSCVDSPFFDIMSSSFSNFQGLSYFPHVPNFPSFSSSYLPYESKNMGSKDFNEHNLEPQINLQLIPFYVQNEGSRVGFNDEKERICSNLDPYGGDLIISALYKNENCHQDFNYLKGPAVPHARLNAFKQKVLPKLLRGNDKRVLIYVPDFYDAECIRVILKTESLEFCSINEYTSDTEADKFKSLFNEEKIRILVLSERYYFFKRRKIFGACNFIFLGPPTFPWFATEILSLGYFSKHKKTKEVIKEPDAKKSKLSSLMKIYNCTILYFPLLEGKQLASLLGSSGL